MSDGGDVRRVSLMVGLVTALILAGLTGAFVLGRIPLPAFIAVAVAISAPGVVMVALASRRAQRAADAERRGALGALGLTVVEKPGRALAARFFAPFEHLKELNSGSKGLVWLAGDSCAVAMFEHRFVMSTGQAAATIFHTVSAARCPASWPALSLSPENVLHRLAAAFGHHDIRVEDDAFNRRWHVKGDDENFAVLLLTPEVQAFLRDAPGVEHWRIGRGVVCCVRKRRCRGEELAVLAARPAELLSLVPRELDAWEAQREPRAHP